MPNPNQPNDRLTRIETKLSKLMQHLGCDPNTGLPINGQVQDARPVGRNDTNTEVGTRRLGVGPTNKGQ